MRSTPSRTSISAVAAAALIALGLLALPAQAAPGSPDLLAAKQFAVLAVQSVSNTGSSVITGDVGTAPGTSLTGFPPGIILGIVHSADGVALTAQNNLTAAYNDAAGSADTADLTGQDLGGKTLTPGVYSLSSSAQLTGDLTLDAQADPDAIFIFKIGTSLTTASASSVNLINGASPCNLYWQVGCSAVLGTDTTFVGNVMSDISITMDTGASLEGRALARTGSVTLDTNVINRPTCDDVVTPTPVPSTPAPTTPTTAAPTSPAPSTPSASPSDSPSGTSDDDDSSDDSPGDSSGGGTPGTGTPSGTPSSGTPTGTPGTDTPVPTGHPRTGLGGLLTASPRV